MNKVDMSQLAKKMLRWEEAQLFADDLRAMIEATVMQIGKTHTVGSVRAAYSGGRKTYDYEAGANGVDKKIIGWYTITPPSMIDWRRICEHVKIPKADIPFTQSEPSVTVKLLAE